jgi:hypothetical protein
MPSRDQSDYTRRLKYKVIVQGGGQGNILNRYTDMSSVVAMGNYAGRSFTGRDATVPDTPLSVTGVIGNGIVTITVTDGADGGSPIIGYAYSIDNAAGPYTDIPYSSPFEIGELTNGTTYTLYIKAKNAIGYSVNPASITLTPATVPDPPTLDPAVTSDMMISIAFTSPANDGGSPVTGHKYSVDGGSYNTVMPSNSPLVLTGLVNGQSYTVRMKATNSLGDSNPSDAVIGIPSRVPFAPLITGITPGNMSLNVAFTAGQTGGAAITNYEYSTDNGSTFKALSPVDTTSPITITTLSSSGFPAVLLSNDTTYQVQIRAVNARGSGIASNTVNGTPSSIVTRSFTTVGSDTWTVPDGVTSVEYIVVGGGGGGGAGAGTGAGGGAGGGSVKTGTLIVTPGEVCNIAVGTGGLGGTIPSGNSSNGMPGTGSIFKTITALGGGLGFRNGATNESGFYGRGGAAQSGDTPTTGGSGGNVRDGGGNPNQGAGGGGGGAGSAGVTSTSNDSDNNRGGDGGVGIFSTLENGTNKEYGKGGKGADEGTQAFIGTLPGANGTATTGNGGGGGASHWLGGNAAPGGSGGSGIVILKYTA